MYPNPLKQRLKNGELILGTGLPAPSPLVTGAVLRTRPDFIWIDTEHAAFGTEALDTIPVLTRQRGVAPMIRVAWNDPALIKKAYDVGAVAVMVPQVDTPEAAARAAEYAYYPPEGNRGITPTWSAVAGEDWNHVIKTANQETVLVIQLESREAYDNIDEIKKIPGIDVILVGPLDLSGSVGTIADTGSREVQEIMEDVPKRLEGTGIATGTTLLDIADIQQKIRWGYRFLNVGNALAYGVQTVQKNLETLRANPTGEA